MASYLTLRWIPDLKAESDLAELSVAFEVESIPFSKFDLKESRYNGARITGPFVATLIEDYATAMENGDAFPRIVCHNTPTGYVILGGNQRVSAIETLINAGKLPKDQLIDSYVIKTKDKLLLEIIARSGNVGHGGRSEKEERIAHALYSVRSLGMTAKDAAKLFIVSDATINNHIRAEEERKFHASHGINVSSMPNASLLEIAKIDDLQLKTKLAGLASQHVVSHDRLGQAVKAIRKAKTQQSRIGVVKNLEGELAESAHRTRTRDANTPRKVPKRPRRDRVISLLTNLANFLEAGRDGEPLLSMADLQVADIEDRKTIQGLWGRVAIRMEKIVRAK